MKTRKQKLAIKGLASVLIIGFFAGIALVPGLSANAYNCRSGDTACEEARANMQAKQNEANSYNAQANTVSGIISQLNSEIAELNAQIAANEARIAELNAQIAATEQKLLDEQTALAELLIDVHFSGNADPIQILAGSSSISDLAEKSAREEVVKKSIAAASEKVKATREELNGQKTEVESTLKANESEKKMIASKKADQQRLLSSLESSADSAELAAQYWEEQLQKLAWVPPSNTTGMGTRWWGAGDSYPYRGNCPRDNVRYSAYGGAVCQCTSYASYKAYEKWGISNTWGGHAKSYANTWGGRYVPNTGGRTYVNQVAEAYTIAVDTTGEYGHVMWVESVNNDGTINVTEYNVSWSSIGCYAGGFCSRQNVGTAGKYFIHFQ